MTIRRPGRRAVRALLAVAIAVAPLVTAAAARADAVPADAQAHGFIGFCDRNDHPVVGGDVGAAPFVWKAVASQGPPAAYQGKGQNAVLNVYQPRPGVDAAEWSGDQLTAATFYTIKAAPAVQSTLKDIPLSVVVKEFPPLVDGLYELRMYFGRANYGLYSATYPATFIRVDGDHWSVLKGGTVNCAAASGESTEVLAGTVTRQAAYGGTPPKPAHGKPSAAPTLPKPSAPANGHSSGGKATSAAAAVPSTVPAAAVSTGKTATASSSGGSSAAWWLVPLAVAAAAAGVFALRRRSARRAS